MTGAQGCGRAWGSPRLPSSAARQQAPAAGGLPRTGSPPGATAHGAQVSFFSPKMWDPDRACPDTTKPVGPAQAPGKAVTHRARRDPGRAAGPAWRGRPCLGNSLSPSPSEHRSSSRRPPNTDFSVPGLGTGLQGGGGEKNTAESPRAQLGRIQAPHPAAAAHRLPAPRAAQQGGRMVGLGEVCRNATGPGCTELLGDPPAVRGWQMEPG